MVARFERGVCMEPEEINGLLWERLASAPGPLSSEQLARMTGQPLVAIQTSLSRLRQAQLVEDQRDGTFRALVALDAMRWAQAVGLGVDLLTLERHAHLSAAGRAEALRLATDGSLERIERKAREDKLRARADAVHGRAASRAAATDLAQILKDTQAASVAATARSNDGRQAAIAALLAQASQEAEQALQGLVKSLAGK